MIPAAGGASRIIASGASSLDDMQLTSDGKTMIYTGQSGSAPWSFIAPRPRAARRLRSRISTTRCSRGYALTPLEEFWVDGPDKTRIQSFVVKPPEFRGRVANIRCCF